jgi:hypothetical protein
MLVPLLIEGIKELSVKVDRLENEIKIQEYINLFLK